MPNSTASIARFSTGKANIQDAPNFSWEYPVPDNDFWNALKYPSARNFLTCFSQHETEEMHLERYGSLSKEEKAQTLIKILQDKISSSESPEQPLWTTNHAVWERLMMAIGTIYGELGRLDEQIQIAETLVEKRVDKSNPSHVHALAALLEQRGDYERAEELERPCTEYMDSTLGKHSPQSNSSRRIIARSVWMQGRQSEAEVVISELFDLIEASAVGKYAVYQESEKKMAEEMAEDLKTRRPKT